MFSWGSDDAAQDHRVLGRALRELRKRAGITQGELAARAGIGATYISALENGRRGIRWHSVTRLLAGIGVTLGDLAALIAEIEQADPER